MRTPSITPKHYDLPAGMVDGVGDADDNIRWQPKTFEQFLAELPAEQRAEAEARHAEMVALGDGPEGRARLLERLQTMKQELEK